MSVDFRSRLEVRGESWEQGEGPDCRSAGDVSDSERFSVVDDAGVGEGNGRVEEVACAGVPEVVLQIQARGGEGGGVGEGIFDLLVCG